MRSISRVPLGGVNRLSKAEAAIWYASHGMPVVPVHYVTATGACSCRDGHDCASKGKHPIPPRGHRAGTCDIREIRRQWRRHPEASVGLRCDETSGLLVLDVDGDKGGLTTLDRLEAAHGPIRTMTALTGSGNGLHKYLRHPGRGIRNGTGRLSDYGPGIDVRGDGLVVAPPSAHRSGGRYLWEFSPASAADRRDGPAWLLDILDPPPPPPKVLAVPQTAASTATSGCRACARVFERYWRGNLRNRLDRLDRLDPDQHRNVHLYASARRMGEVMAQGQALGLAVPEAVIRDTLLGAGEVLRSRGWADSTEAMTRTVDSGLRRGLGDPDPEFRGCRECAS